MLKKVKRTESLEHTKLLWRQLEVVQDAMENMELCDVWIIFNPDCKRYIWRQRQPEIHCRLDFFLVSQSILGISTYTDITPGFKTYSITVGCDKTKSPRKISYLFRSH